ncbi:MAG: hypothetical protein ABIP51_23585 [Bacteroidia bacterium]
MTEKELTEKILADSIYKNIKIPPTFDIMNGDEKGWDGEFKKKEAKRKN